MSDRKCTIFQGIHSKDSNRRASYRILAYPQLKTVMEQTVQTDQAEP